MRQATRQAQASSHIHRIASDEGSDHRAAPVHVPPRHRIASKRKRTDSRPGVYLILTPNILR